MKLIDKNGRFFEKISILDITILLVVILLICSFVFSKTGNTDNSLSVSKQEVDFTSEIKVYGVSQTETSPFSDVKNIYSSDGELIGEIVSVEMKPTTTKVKCSDGRYVDAVSTGFVDYFITVKGIGTESDKGIFASGSVAMIPNNILNISSRMFTGSAIVLSVEKAN